MHITQLFYFIKKTYNLNKLKISLSFLANQQKHKICIYPLLISKQIKIRNYNCDITTVIRI